jgi:hypothetical protein
MPTPDFPLRRPRRNTGLAWLAWAEAMKRRKRKPGKDGDRGGVPVEPDRPNTLTGGAAAELDFED